MPFYPLTPLGFLGIVDSKPYTPTSNQQELLPNRSLQEVIRHFYLWKQTDEYRSWKAERPLQYVEAAIPDYHADTCDVRWSD